MLYIGLQFLGGRGSGGGKGSGVSSGAKKSKDEDVNMAVNAEMPKLTGSPKQVSWAESIRQSFLRNADSLVSAYLSLDARGRRVKDVNLARDTLQYTLQDAKDIQKQAIETMRGVTKASDIIDRRYVLQSTNTMLDAVKDLHRSRRK